MTQSPPPSSLAGLVSASAFMQSVEANASYEYLPVY